METAFEQAEEALQVGEVPIGCAIVDPQTDKIIATGRNRTNEHRNATRHAEIEAISELHRAGWTDFTRLLLYVTVEPCIMCAAALRMLRFKHVYYGCKNERFGGCGSIMDAASILMRQWPELPVTQVGGQEGAKAILLLRKFYLRENDRAPQPRKKINRVLKTE